MSRNRIIAFAVPFFIVALTVLGGAAPSSADRGGREAVRSSVRGGSQPVARQGGRDFVTRSPGRGGYVGRGGSSTRYLGPRYSHGHSHFSGSIWIGPGWGWDPFFYPYYPYQSYRYYAPPTVVVPQEPQEYLVPEADEQEETGYWYYCRKPEGFYPYVERCPSGWMRVVPDTTPPEGVLEDKDDKENEDE